MEHIIGGKKVLVNDEDEHIFNSYKWHISDNGYVVWRGTVDGKKKTIRLHRLIAKPLDGFVVDHINRNRLDNRRENLRCVTQAENIRNSDRVENAKGYYHSESKCRVHNKWVVDYMGINNTFKTESEAKLAVEQIKKGTFVKAKDKNKKICSRCGTKKELYGGRMACKKCTLRRCKEYYQRKKGEKS